ncbi:hypothetical protein MYXA107069_02810 [Myxococcus xanthus]|nr:hypothetical protein MyxoNM_00660 [Myxococcus xanthus]SDX37124.1 hypothetical protein SAMN05444383_107186 [Myxococcus xanthus]
MGSGTSASGGGASTLMSVEPHQTLKPMHASVKTHAPPTSHTPRPFPVRAGVMCVTPSLSTRRFGAGDCGLMFSRRPPGCVCYGATPS